MPVPPPSPAGDGQPGGVVPVTSSAAMRLTPADIDVLRFVGRCRFATVPQVARWAGRTEKKIYPRLLGMRSHELVEFHRPLNERGVYVATRAGLAVAGLDLPPARIDLATFTHDRLVADLAVSLETAGMGVVTEREMRHSDESPDTLDDGGPRYAVVLPTGGRHYPDLLAVTPSGHYQAVEVELTPKNLARRQRILAGYARARHIETVTYHVTNPTVGDLVRRSAAQLGITDLIEVRPLTQAGVAA
ncbi:MAG: hypothetical protein ACRDH5_13485 [bacterium]